MIHKSHQIAFGMVLIIVKLLKVQLAKLMLDLIKSKKQQVLELSTFIYMEMKVIFIPAMLHTPIEFIITIGHMQNNQQHHNLCKLAVNHIMNTFANSIGCNHTNHHIIIAISNHMQALLQILE